MTKQGSGTLTLSGTNNTYSGTTTINLGSLQACAIGTFSSSSAVSLSNTASAVLDLNGFDNTILSLSGGGATGGNVTLGAGTLTVGNSSSTTYSGAISGTGGVTKQGSGTLTLSGINNTYSETTTINLGSLQAGAIGTFSSSSAVSLANTAFAVLDLNGFDNTILSLSGGGATGGNITLGAGTLTVGNGSNTTYSGAISGTGGVTKQGSGTLTLSGTNNTYSGITTINLGSLQAGAIGTFSSSSAVSLANTASAVLDLNGFDNTILSLSGGGATGGNVTLGAGTLTVGNSSSTTYGGAISGTGGVTKQGSGTLTLSGTNNTYSGITTINLGSLQAGAIGTFSSSSAVSFANTASAVLDLNGFNNTILSLSGGGATGGNVTLGAGTLTVGNSSSTTYSGAISGTGGVTKQGSGTLTLSGINNTYSGTTTINLGSLQAGAIGTFSSSSAVFFANTASAVLDLNGFDNTILSLSGGGATGGNVTLGAGTLTVGNSSSTTYGGAISGTGGVTKQGSGTLTLSGTNNTYSGITTIN